MMDLGKAIDGSRSKGKRAAVSPSTYGLDALVEEARTAAVSASISEDDIKPVPYTIKLPAELVQEIKDVCKKNGYQIGQFCTWLFRDGLDAFYAGKRPQTEPLEPVQKVRIVE